MAGKGRKGKKKSDPPPAGEEAKLTPYQGTRRTFGWFRCPDCQKSWGSAYSWANRSQKCNVCKVDVYPYRQAPPEKCEEVYVSNPEKNHEQSLCEKCREVGGFCGKGQRGGPRGKRKRRNRRGRAAAA